jgi:hypothetical protein
LTRFEFESGIVLFYFSFNFVSLENHVCLSRGMHVAGATWCTAMRTVTEVRDLVQRIGDGRTSRILGGRAVKRSGSAVCSLYLTREDEERGFLD